MKEEKVKIEELSPSDYDKEDYKVKIIIVGDSGVGKTNLITRFASDKFDQNSKATIGVEFIYKTLKINKDVFKIEIWDTAGEERYKSITSAYYKGAKGAIIVYDITSEQSFDNIETWIQEVKGKASNNLQILIIGNKSDLSKDRKVSSEQGIEKAKTLNLHLFEASALDKTNVNEAFNCLFKEMYLDIKNRARANMNNNEMENLSKGAVLNTENKQKKKCC